MAQHKDYAYDQAASLLKIQGIISIIFGILGLVISGIVLIVLGFVLLGVETDAEAFAVTIISALFLVLFVVPHVYYIVSGVTLSRHPSPQTARILTIINLIIGIFWNYILLVFAIISLVQSSDYERGYKEE